MRGGTAVADTSAVDLSDVEEQWAQINSQINSDLEHGLLMPDKGAADPDTPLVSNLVSETESSDGKGGNKGTGTRKGNIGTYPERAGVILVTPDAIAGLIPTGHAGIVLSRLTAIEAVAWKVKRMSNTWFIDKRQAYGVTVIGTSTLQDTNAARWADRQVGKPYNVAYWDVNTRNKFYCSQLVWASFKDTVGVDLNTSQFGSAVHPMELVRTPKTRLLYRMRPE